MELSTKTRPSQNRGYDTFELIVQTAGRLLESIGFEQLTTNLVCKEAGLSPPALYRYFPNKHAILRELGDRLMKAQDEAAIASMDAGGAPGSTVDDRVRQSVEVVNRIIEITRSFPGNIAITRALRAIPMLKDVRISSRNNVAQHQAIALARIYPNIPFDELQICSKMSIEMSYMAIEMALEEPKEEANRLVEATCRAVTLYIDDIHRTYDHRPASISSPAGGVPQDGAGTAD
ncbi:TetR/AcrR family transcriptional regulator [Sphingobium sp.]|uniref:TetR/AcrR family transcriptional regulator n=1 Tax=Sphingobium sp. TaxID=1912891 RepID=UPI0028BE9316|nr:TetR/AcrR family transcriptional regulator [Sphingobium sp.]